MKRGLRFRFWETLAAIASDPSRPAVALRIAVLERDVAGFGEWLYVAATATNGWGRQSQFDASVKVVAATTKGAKTADLAHLLDRAIAEAEREAPGIAVYRNYAPEIPPFPFDAELMERVFFNLVLNAAQATAPGGAVTVKTRAAGGTELTS